MRTTIGAFALVLLLAACAQQGTHATAAEDQMVQFATQDRNISKNLAEPTGPTKLATFAGGCFWCMEPPFEKLGGVIAVTSGYAGGSEKDPTYEDVSSGSTGHLESVQVEYDPAQVTYEELLDVFWQNVDPTDDGGQFVDRGKQYRTSIFYHDDEQRVLAQKSKAALAATGKYEKPIVTPIVPLVSFYPAEGYHQDYYKKNPARYKFYRYGSGRDQYLDGVWGDNRTGHEQITPRTQQETGSPAQCSAPGCTWGTFAKPSGEQLRSKLTPMQYKVTQEEGTEGAFTGPYWDSHEDGIYVDVVSGEPLFSSKDKFDSGTGWPSFTRPINESNIVEKEDRGLFSVRTEVRSAHADSHLGHVFDDGPTQATPGGPEPTGMRYCMNGAALRFVPLKDLEKEGYGEYRKLFE
jgi:peptide methionine sulfoxide reductase msrA/msrB